MPTIKSFVRDLLRQPPGGLNLEEVYRRDPATKSSTVERLYAELRHRTVHYMQPASQELADVLWNHSGYPAQIQFRKTDGGRPRLWFQWVQAVTAADVYGDVQDHDFLKSMKERDELLAAIAMSWMAVASVAVVLHLHRLGIESSRVGQVPEPPPGATP